MATAAQRRRYWAYRKLMQARGLRQYILPLETWIKVPKGQSVPMKAKDPGEKPKPRQRPSEKMAAKNPKKKKGITIKTEE